MNRPLTCRFLSTKMRKAACTLSLVGVSLFAQDSNLKLHLNFESISSTGTVFDQSGNNSHAIQFNATNSIDSAAGVFGSLAGLFSYVGFMSNDYPNIYPLSQYLGVTNVSSFQYLTNGTISFWAQFAPSRDLGMRILDTGYNPVFTPNPPLASNSWAVSRANEANLSFTVYTPDGPIKIVSWPDDLIRSGSGSPALSTTDFHLYSLTFDCLLGTATAYYDGSPVQTSALPVPWVRIYGGSAKRWLCIGAMAHAGTPEWGDDRYPNSGFFAGLLDDVRIYSRTLSSSEVRDLFVGSAVSVAVTATDEIAGEPESGHGNGTFTFTRTGSTSQALTINYTVTGSATRGQDYTALQTSATFPVGSASMTKTVSVLDDQVSEFDEIVVVKLTAGSSYTTTSQTATVTIRDDDPIIDDPDAAFAQTWTLSSGVPGYFGTGYRHDQDSGKGTKSAKFTPNLPARGKYAVYIRYPADSNRATNVPVDIVHAWGTNTLTVNQQFGGNTWNLLGTFDFSAGSGGYVRIRNTGTVGYVIADAIKFVPRTPMVAIAGSARYYTTEDSLKGVSVTISGGTNLVTTTAPDGRYSAWVYGGLNYGIAPGALTDTPPAKGVSTLDIALIRRHILGSDRLNSPYKLLAADVTASDSVSTVDIAFIRRLVLGATNSLPGGLWRFVPAEVSFSNPESPWHAPTDLWLTNVVADSLGQDFVAVKLGDVNNSWRPPTLGAALMQKATKATGPPPSDSYSARISLAKYSAHRGERLSTAVNLDGLDGATTLQFTLRWDPSILRYADVGHFGIPLVPANFGVHLLDRGLLTFAWDEPQGLESTLPDGTAAFSITFDVIGDPGSISPLEIVSVPTSIEATRSLMPVNLVVESGWVAVAEPRLLASARSVNGRRFLDISVATEADAAYVLEYSDSLQEWEILHSFVGDGSTRLFTESISDFPQRFYRARRQ